VIGASAKGEATTFDAAGFVARVEPVLPSAYRLAAAMLHSSSDADDAVQEALFKAWRHFGRFRPEADMKPWLLTIVANECRGQRRNRWSSVVTFADRADVEPSANAELDAEVADLRAALYRLPHNQRLVLVLRYYLDLDFDEMGAILKTSTKAAKSRTYRALERLRLSPEVLADE
jgi:RNA polymerase sigma-70 factor (ECF subfamily)